MHLVYVNEVNCRYRKTIHMLHKSWDTVKKYLELFDADLHLSHTDTLLFSAYAVHNRV